MYKRQDVYLCITGDGFQCTLGDESLLGIGPFRQRGEPDGIGRVRHFRQPGVGRIDVAYQHLFAVCGDFDVIRLRFIGIALGFVRSTAGHIQRLFAEKIEPVAEESAEIYRLDEMCIRDRSSLLRRCRQLQQQ